MLKSCHCYPSFTFGFNRSNPRNSSKTSSSLEISKSSKSCKKLFIEKLYIFHHSAFHIHLLHHHHDMTPKSWKKAFQGNWVSCLQTHPSKLLSVENLRGNHVALAVLLFTTLAHKCPLILKQACQSFNEWYKLKCLTTGISEIQ